jgi:hypothetical protein
MSPTLPDQPDDLVVFLDSVMEGLSGEPTESLSILEKAIQDLEQFAEHEEYGEARAYLEANVNLNQALVCVQAAKASAAVEFLKKASQGFTELEIEDMASLCVALQTHLEGVLEIQRRNFASGLELMKKAEMGLSSPRDRRGRLTPDGRNHAARSTISCRHQ